MTALNSNNTVSPDLGAGREMLVLRHELIGFYVFVSDFIVIATSGAVFEIVYINS